MLTKKQKQKIIEYYYNDRSIWSIVEDDNEIGEALDNENISEKEIEDFLRLCYETVKTIIE